MAEDKRGFVLYADLIHTIKKMSKERAGELFLIILKYVNDENPVINDELLDLVFEPIKQQLKRDLKKYENKKVQWSKAGKASANKRQQPSTDVQRMLTDSTVIVKDTVTVKDNVKVKDIKKGSEIKISAPSKIDFLDLVIEEFKRLYEESNELPYAVINKGKERAATGKLIAQYKSVHPDHNSDETIKGLGLYFDKVVNINDSWLRSNMTLPILMSKFNEVNNILRNGKSTSNKGGSDKEFFNVVSQRLTGK